MAAKPAPPGPKHWFRTARKKSCYHKGGHDTKQSYGHEKQHQPPSPLAPFRTARPEFLPQPSSEGSSNWPIQGPQRGSETSPIRIDRVFPSRPASSPSHPPEASSTRFEKRDSIGPIQIAPGGKARSRETSDRLRHRSGRPPASQKRAAPINPGATQPQRRENYAYPAVSSE